jgi:glucose dehydrogenase
MDPDDGSIRWHYQWTPARRVGLFGVNEKHLFEEAGASCSPTSTRTDTSFILDRVTGARVAVVKFYDRAKLWAPSIRRTGRGVEPPRAECEGGV